MARPDTTCPQPRQVALYRFYDAHEQLLYAGISNEPWRRRKQHSVTQPWYPQVRHQAITWYDSEGDARAAEVRAIRSEHPQFNVAGAVRPARSRLLMRPARCAIVAWLWLDAVMVLLIATMSVDSLRPELVIVTIAAAAACPFVSLAALVVAAAPWISRFGSWIERNSAGLPLRSPE